MTALIDLPSQNLGNKILIIGCAGSGKTTLANLLAKKLDIPVIHMDRYYWTKNWGRVEDDQWHDIVLSLCEKDEWIMDGNYTATLPIRFAYATSIIYMDIPRWKCLLRAFIRRFKFFHNRKRQDIPDNCHDRINLAFYRWIWHYPTHSRPKTLALLEAFSGPKYIIKNKQDIDNILTNL